MHLVTVVNMFFSEHNIKVTAVAMANNRKTEDIFRVQLPAAVFFLSFAVLKEKFLFLCFFFFE